MQLPSVYLFFLLFVSTFVTPGSAADPREFKERRQRTSKAFSDGILLLHSKTATSYTEDGYREEAPFYYLTGLENSPSAILAIVGKSGDSWLFLNTNLSGDVHPGAEAERKLDIQHVVDWSELDRFLTRQIATGTVIYFEPGRHAARESFRRQGRTNAHMGPGSAEKMAYSGVSTRRQKAQYTDGSRKQLRAAGFTRGGAGYGGRVYGRDKGGSSRRFPARR